MLIGSSLVLYEIYAIVPETSAARLQLAAAPHTENRNVLMQPYGDFFSNITMLLFLYSSLLLNCACQGTVPAASSCDGIIALRTASWMASVGGWADDAAAGISGQGSAYMGHS